MKPKSPVQKNNLVVFPCEYTHVYPQKIHMVYLDCYNDMHSHMDQLSNFSVKLPLSLSV